MNRVTFSNSSARRALLVLVLTAAVTGAACDNDIDFNPAAPTFPNVTTAGPGRSLEIRGSLTTAQGSCLEATVLYDGKELAGGRTSCPDDSGCTRVELAADAESTSGHHTISFQVLSQSPEAVDYTAEGRVLGYREGISMVMTVDLAPTRATLRPGESVTFEVDFLNFVN